MTINVIQPPLPPPPLPDRQYVLTCTHEDLEIIMLALGALGALGPQEELYSAIYRAFEHKDPRYKVVIPHAPSYMVRQVSSTAARKKGLNGNN